jgi:hypothetical protein
MGGCKKRFTRKLAPTLPGSTGRILAWLSFPISEIGICTKPLRGGRCRVFGLQRMKREKELS